MAEEKDWMEDDDALLLCLSPQPADRLTALVSSVARKGETTVA